MPRSYAPHPAITKFQVGEYAGFGLFNSAWLQQIKIDPDLTSAIVCVDLYFGFDKYVRISNKKCTTINSITGEEYHYDGVLAEVPEIDWSITPGSASSNARSISFVLPADLVDAPSLIASSKTLGGIGEITLQLDGFDHKDRIVLLRGDLTDVTYGAIDQTVSCSLTDPKATSDALVPSVILTTGRFQYLVDKSVGKALPLVLPKFEPIEAHFVTQLIISPTVVCAYGHLDVTAVYVDGFNYPSGSVFYPWEQQHDVDAYGDPVTLVYFTGGTGRFSGDGSESVYVTLINGQTNGHPVQVAKEIVASYSMLGTRGAVEYLYALAEASSGYLTSQVAINASGSKSATAFGFIESELMGSFPMFSMMWWGGGYGPTVCDRSLDHVVVDLIADQWPILDRASLVTETSKSECFNYFSIHFDYDSLEDSYRGFAARSPENSAICAYSRDLIGMNFHDPIESLWIKSEETANRVLEWLIRHKTIPSYDVDYDCSAQLALKLIPGNNVTITDPDFGWVRQRATVIRTCWKASHGQITLRLWNNAVAEIGAAFGYASGAVQVGGQGGGGGSNE